MSYSARGTCALESSSFIKCLLLCRLYYSNKPRDLCRCQTFKLAIDHGAKTGRLTSSSSHWRGDTSRDTLSVHFSAIILDLHLQDRLDTFVMFTQFVTFTPPCLKHYNQEYASCYAQILLNAYHLVAISHKRKRL